MRIAADDPEETKKIFDQGVAAYDAKNYAEAFQIFSSIDDRDLAAMRNEALMLRKGLGMAKDPKAAEEMYPRAAQGGLATAAADLGEMLLKGEAGPPDVKAALPWLAAAADAGHPVAAFELAELYETGVKDYRAQECRSRPQALRTRGRRRDGRGEAALEVPAPGRAGKTPPLCWTRASKP